MEPPPSSISAKFHCRYRAFWRASISVDPGRRRHDRCHRHRRHGAWGLPLHLLLLEDALGFLLWLISTHRRRHSCLLNRPKMRHPPRPLRCSDLSILLHHAREPSTISPVTRLLRRQPRQPPATPVGAKVVADAERTQARDINAANAHCLPTRAFLLNLRLGSDCLCFSGNASGERMTLGDNCGVESLMMKWVVK
ncbi:hypothetical protein DEO72_LG3g3321 [Vigna unguiculata]|uniref:Uncharacterized protein n=1 Tax=Vigna unguiculata TaxID=3917 RepID=A0A4D6LJR3_VIGUN|nr:hypothetical protein DEO72_LG3g3321 [Vigna unguiculata]